MPDPGIYAKLRAKALPEPIRKDVVPLQLITRDPEVNTRSVDEGWVSRRVPVFSEAAMGTLSVSLRADGTYVVLDGQHRAALKRAAGHATGDVKCEIWENITKPEEAALFSVLNDKRALTPLARFLARLTEQDPAALAIQEIADRTSFRILENDGPGILRCVTTLERIHKNDKARRKGARPNDLERTLRCIAEAWGHGPGTSASVLIGGLGAVFNKHEEAVDVAVMVKALAGYEGVTAAKLCLDARGLHAFRHGKIQDAVSEIIVKEYRKYAGSRRKIPEWRH